MDEMLQEKATACQREMQSTKNEIDRLEKIIDVLTVFESEVSDSKDKFQTANSRKKELLSSLGQYSNQTACIQKFGKGMGNTLTGVGMKMVGVTFVNLRLSLAAKKAAYMTRKALLEANLIKLSVEKEVLDGAIALGEKL